MEDSKDTNQVYYCKAGGHFWHWQWTIESGGYWFPAYISPDDVGTNDVINAYCGCND